MAIKTRTKTKTNTTSPSTNSWNVVQVVEICSRSVFRSSVTVVVGLLTTPVVMPIVVKLLGWFVWRVGVPTCNPGVWRVQPVVL